MLPPGASPLNDSKSSTAANKADRDLFQSGNVYVNTSTPMINPDAVQSQDKMLNAPPVPQPKQESSSKRGEQQYENKESVGAKPDEMGEAHGNAPGVLPMPGEDE